MMKMTHDHDDYHDQDHDVEDLDEQIIAQFTSTRGLGYILWPLGV